MNTVALWNSSGAQLCVRRIHTLEQFAKSNDIARVVHRGSDQVDSVCGTVQGSQVESVLSSIDAADIDITEWDFLSEGGPRIDGAWARRGAGVAAGATAAGRAPFIHMHRIRAPTARLTCAAWRPVLDSLVSQHLVAARSRSAMAIASLASLDGLWCALRLHSPVRHSRRLLVLFARFTDLTAPLDSMHPERMRYPMMHSDQSCSHLPDMHCAIWCANRSPRHFVCARNMRTLASGLGGGDNRREPISRRSRR